MATIYLDNHTYNDAVLYAKLHNISVSDAIKAGMKALFGSFKPNPRSISKDGYYISPKVKALETGFVCPTNLSEDYKDEVSDVLINKYL